MSDTRLCACGHTAHWHGQVPGDAKASGHCEHDGECRCTRFCEVLSDRGERTRALDEEDRLRVALLKLADADLASWMAQPAYGVWVRETAREALNGETT